MFTRRLISLVGLMLGAYVQLGAQTTHRSLNTAPGAPDDAEAALIREFPDALIYQGYFLFVAGERLEAARVWERYLEVAPAGADTASVINLIEEAYGRAFPDWFVYKGFALFQAGDFIGAERVWQRYLEIASDGSDQDAVRILIGQARERQREASRS